MDDNKEYCSVDIYADSTGLFTDWFCNYTTNIVVARVERKVLFEYFKEYVEQDFRDEDEIDGNWDDKKLFDEWITNYYTCDDVDTLYDWCLEQNKEILIDGIK